jgi:outer membrane protein OmpA-like peptidoglycan-associated protein
MNHPSALLLFACFTAGCASVPPPQLVEARNAYVNSNNGLAGKLVPTDLYDARKALDQANQEFEKHGNTLECRDYAYVAQRKLELADVKARTERDRQRIAAAAKAGVNVRDAQARETNLALQATRNQLQMERQDSRELAKDLRATNQAQERDLEKSQAQLQEQTTARLSTEAQLAGAMKDLATIAAVKEEPRGVVITLSGAVLFASGQHKLLNTASSRLDQVAEALKNQDETRRMMVEGHTDSLGSDATNQPLSFDRANAVRDYLVARGVEPQRIMAMGMGSSHPVVDNNTAENRANNRRVEIIIGN